MESPKHQHRLPEHSSKRSFWRWARWKRSLDRKSRGTGLERTPTRSLQCVSSPTKLPKKHQELEFQELELELEMIVDETGKSEQLDLLHLCRKDQRREMEEEKSQHPVESALQSLMVRC